MLQSRSAFRALAKNRTNSPSPSSRQGRLFPPFSRISVFYVLGSNLPLRPVELGPVDPHAMQNDCELARDRDLGPWFSRSRLILTSSARLAGYPDSIVAVALVDLHLEHGLGMARVNADHR